MAPQDTQERAALQETQEQASRAPREIQDRAAPRASQGLPGLASVVTGPSGSTGASGATGPTGTFPSSVTGNLTVTGTGNFGNINCGDVTGRFSYLAAADINVGTVKSTSVAASSVSCDHRLYRDQRLWLWRLRWDVLPFQSGRHRHRVVRKNRLQRHRQFQQRIVYWDRYFRQRIVHWNWHI